MKELGKWAFDVPSAESCSWTICLNGGNADIEHEPDGGMKMTIPPFYAAVWWNGWVAGLVSPGGGTIAAHPEGANEDRLLDDLKRLTETDK